MDFKLQERSAAPAGAVREQLAAEESGASSAAASPAAACDLSVVIPVFNEEERIVSTIGQVSDYLMRQGKSYEVIISDDGSHDGGPVLIDEEFAGVAEVRLIREEVNQGKGAAVRRGMLAARGAQVIFTDADLAYPVETIGLCVEALEVNDVAVGSRNLPGSEIEITPPPLRRLAGPVFKAAVRSLVLPGFTDTQCGFKGFKAAAARRIFSNCHANGFAFDVEVLALARLYGYMIAEVPVRLSLDSSDSRINLTTDPFRMLGEIIRIRKRIRRMKGAEAPDVEPSSAESE